MTRSQRRRTWWAVALLVAAVIVNVVILANGQESPGWPLAAIVLLGAAAISLIVQRRPYE
jgi:hypothetical protein